MPFWANKRVAITGHTGFKGSWLSVWLQKLGADLYGYALKPKTNPALYNQLAISKNIQEITADIRSEEHLKRWILDTNPDVVFHLAAQPLVRFSYKEARATWEINVLGTVNLLEALRVLDKHCAVVIVTTDKVYENFTKNTKDQFKFKEASGYREWDKLGGRDPYSSSKAASELAVSSWRSSFFENNSPISIATVRAGNVIGGGDWSEDRIVPDCIRSLKQGKIIPVRNKFAARPWQHVLEPISGYIMLAEGIYKASIASDTTILKQLCSGFNFGPNNYSNRTVLKVVEEIIKHWPGQWKDFSDPKAVYEAESLNINTEKALKLLKWKPVWNFQKTIQKTVSWYNDSFTDISALKLTEQQIIDYTSDAKTLGLAQANLI